ncbi:hypothetical protein DVK85_12935 [Flavobacterium arcticum]|uniref:Uncharacterized protein n=1 Tax=Flavobacterium arcticum TaxID=1784713 RepID=A0A345HES4_9FLAO|nr:hypothetical protein [Flavobacterium arcticum]AXG75084.1 hypothetical protein DVK85_12935 [Flavobacterium arcticum]KAF2511137.1 hypothetical protein E0W72_07010 [Flavobacterium arcticum]
MKINLKRGIAELEFGMLPKNVEALYGKPDKKYKDDDKNIIYLYNDKKLRLTFYEDELFRLGYIIASHPELEIFSMPCIGQEWETIQPKLKENKIKGFENEVFDSLDNYFNEDNWIIFVVEFGEVVRVELGAVISNQDEFEWYFKG